MPETQWRLHLSNCLRVATLKPSLRHLTSHSVTERVVRSGMEPATAPVSTWLSADLETHGCCAGRSAWSCFDITICKPARLQADSSGPLWRSQKGLALQGQKSLAEFETAASLQRSFMRWRKWVCVDRPKSGRYLAFLPRMDLDNKLTVVLLRRRYLNHKWNQRDPI